MKERPYELDYHGYHTLRKGHSLFALTFEIDFTRPYLISSPLSLHNALHYILAIVITLIMSCGGPTLSSITLIGILGGKVKLFEKWFEAKIAQDD